MLTKTKKYLSFLIAIFFIYSCTVIEQSSSHGFENGYYKLKNTDKSEKVYVDVNEDTLKIYSLSQEDIAKEELKHFPGSVSQSKNIKPVKLRKNSLDIDITSILFKYRTNKNNLPAELTSDFNFALYAGPRFDQFTIQNKTDALGKNSYKVSNKAVDFGIFSGIGTTLVSPYSTADRFDGEYNGMCLQIGVAGFLESNVASFGISCGYDYLLNSDRKIWIYQNRPWIGFIVGIAFN